jgi:ribosomal protein L37AE/L43A
MTYRETLQAVDTLKALKIIGIDGGQQGAYVYFPCTVCGKQAVIKAYGDKKNIWYCPECKDKGHIISLIMKMAGVEWKTQIRAIPERTLKAPLLLK